MGRLGKEKKKKKGWSWASWGPAAGPLRRIRMAGIKLRSQRTEKKETKKKNGGSGGTNGIEAVPGLNQRGKAPGEVHGTREGAHIPNPIAQFQPASSRSCISWELPSNIYIRGGIFF